MQHWGLNMKHLALVASAIAALSGQALAADMPVKAIRPAPVVAAVSWTGCYVGAGGGYGHYYQENTGYDEGPPFGERPARTQMPRWTSTNWLSMLDAWRRCKKFGFLPSKNPVPLMRANAANCSNTYS